MHIQGVVVRKLIFILGLILSVEAYAQVEESELRSRVRNLITRVAGVEWSDKLLGKLAEPVPEIVMPVIPKNFKKSTDVSSYTKKEKSGTEFDKLPPSRRQQFDYQFLKELFLVTRKTEPKDEDLSTWLNTLDQGGSREGIYQALVLDEVYASLENMSEKPSARLKEFIMFYSPKFLAQTFKPESLDDLNLFSHKRIMAEKGLDLLEYYETNDLDSLYRWYALFSADMGEKYAALFKSDVRKSASAKFHYEWAKGMPIQHIKSEFIIKIHMVMNGMQLLQ
jgi:hypothetical protein